MKVTIDDVFFYSVNSMFDSREKRYVNILSAMGVVALFWAKKYIFTTSELTPALSALYLWLTCLGNAVLFSGMIMISIGKWLHSPIKFSLRIVLWSVVFTAIEFLAGALMLMFPTYWWIPGILGLAVLGASVCAFSVSHVLFLEKREGSITECIATNKNAFGKAYFYCGALSIVVMGFAWGLVQPKGAGAPGLGGGMSITKPHSIVRTEAETIQLVILILFLSLSACAILFVLSNAVLCDKIINKKEL